MSKDNQIIDNDKFRKNIKIYNEKLLNKQFLIIFADVESKKLKQLIKNKPKNIDKLRAIEIIFKKENFAHLAGVSKNTFTSLSINAVEFFDNVLNGKIEAKDCKFSKFRNLKAEVFENLPMIFRSISIIGSYDYHREKLEVDKLIGNTKKIPEAILGIKKLNEKIKIPLTERYIPISLLNGITQDFILKNTERKILYIFEKMDYEKKYSKLIFKHKDLYIDNIYNTKDFYNRLDQNLQAKIRNDMGLPALDKREVEITKKIKVDKNKWQHKIDKDKNLELEIEVE